MRANLIILIISLAGVACSTAQADHRSSSDKAIAKSISALNHQSLTSTCLSMIDTSLIFECLSKMSEKEDNNLTETYVRLGSLLRKEPSRLMLVKKSQELWIKFRNAECAFDSSQDSAGDEQSADYAICVIKATVSRNGALSSKLFNLKRYMVEEISGDKI